MDLTKINGAGAFIDDDDLDNKDSARKIPRIPETKP